MKKIISFITMSGTLLIISCQKSEINLTPLSSLNVINAIVNLNTALVNFNSTPGSHEQGQSYADITQTVPFGTNYIYGVLAGKSVNMVVVSAEDTTSIIYNTTVNLVNGGVYSLYLAGQIGSVDTVFAKDNIPSYIDSSTGVRFINLSQGSTVVNVTLDATQSTNEFSNIAYKQITDFKTYSGTATNASYTFDVFQASNDSLLAQYTLSTPIFKNVTLALTGIPSTGLSIAQINNF
jgi:hypothetical protein